jgi:membrane protein DedA with SNARE-associated domain
MTSGLSSVVEGILHLSPVLVYSTVGLLVFAEDALFVGFVLPGETAAVLGGVAASRGNVDPIVMVLVVVAAAIIGDSVGYEVGRHSGDRILRTKPLARHQDRIQHARDLLARRGGVAVVLGRSVAFLRAVTPALAGMARMPYWKFLGYNALGGAIWGVGVVLIGYLAGNSYAAIEKTVGAAAAAVVAVVAIAVFITWRVRHARDD